MIFRSLVIFVLVTTVTKVIDGQQSATACYGTDTRCDFYTMQCESDQIIKLYNLYAGYKNTTEYPVCGTTNHCEKPFECCSLKTYDIIDALNAENTYKTYTNCSAKSYCRDIQAPWQQIGTTTVLYSSYVQLEYFCEYASEKVPFCGGLSGTRTGTYSNVDIMFDGSVEKFDPLKASKECQCTVQNLGVQQNVMFTAIDVRLQTYDKGENQTYADCSSAFFQSPVLGVQCRDSGTPYEDNFHRNINLNLLMTTNQEVEMSLKHIHANGMKDSPAMVWISLQAEQNKGIRVTCKEVIPADFTTSTTSTTTTTTTTSTTTTLRPTTTTTTTTTTPKPTTTTITTTTTPTTTTSTTTPRPPTSTTPKLTPSTTTPKTTTSTTTTTPKPSSTTTTTTSSTKKTTTTTAKPTAISTNPKQTTSTTKTTTSKLTTARTTLKTTTTTTPATTPAPTIKPRPTPKQTTRYVPTTSTADSLKLGDGENDLKQRTAVYLAICVPLIVCLLFITGFLLWIYWKRTSPRRKKINLKMVDTPRAKMYIHNKNDNPAVLDDFINGIDVEQNNPAVLEKPSISTFISVPEPNKKPHSNLSNGSVYKKEQARPIIPYEIPIRVHKADPLLWHDPYLVQVRPTTSKRDNGPVVIMDTVEPEADTDLSQMNDVYEPGSEKDVIPTPEDTDQSQNKSRSTPDSNDGGVVIHVDNLNLPPTSARSTTANTSINTSSTRSEIGSTPGNITPERRNSEPALITTEPVLDRHSASAYILPGSSPEDISVLYTKL